MSSINTILERLHNVHRVSGGGYIACCPAHEDSNPSMSVTERGGKVLLHCHAGCSAESIVSAIGLKMSDLMPPSEDSPIRKAARASKRSREVARYDYQDENGKTAYSVIRYEPKTFRQCHYDSHGSPVWKMDGVKRFPYHLPEVLDTAILGGEVFVVEGEKDVETVRGFGLVATCNAGGAGKWDGGWAKYFKGASRVTVIADNDTPDKGFPGQRHAWSVYNSMLAEGIEARVCVMPDGKDVTEWATKASAHSADEFTAAIERSAPWPEVWRFTDGVEVATEPTEAIFTSLADFPPYTPEEENPNILIRGRWLERGGSAWIVSTAGTGKSIHSIQAALSWSAGIPFSGFSPIRPVKVWIVQSEDSPSRVTIDREDINAELLEQHPEIDWRAVTRDITFVKFPGKVGADFLDALDAALTAAKAKPDIIILNPFLAFVGGPITDGAYVTPFLRGGELNRQPTCGLQDILERHNVASLIYHHTPKPPTEKELKAWMSSTFPEYQGAGSSDITNWGRSLVTMMKVEGHPGVVCLTAGKNGNELGWDSIGGARRHYLAYSNAKGITGRGRHAWRELSPEELDEIAGTDTSEKRIGEMVNEIIDTLRERAMYTNEMVAKWGQSRVATEARKRVINNLTTYRLTKRHELVGGKWRDYFGLTDGIEKAVKMARQQAEIDASRGVKND